MPRANIKGRGKPFQKGADPRRNAKGRPKNEQTWAPNLREVLALSPKELAALYPVLKPMFVNANAAGLTMPSIKAICARIVAALLFEPDARLAAFVADRVDGKMPLPVDVTWQQKMVEAGLDPAEEFERIAHDWAKKLAERRDS